MGLRLWRRIKIAPGVTLNVSKTGLSTSFGPKGAKVTLGRGQIRKTVGLPGTGLFYTSTSKLASPNPPEPVGEPSTSGSSGGGHRLRNAAIALVVLAGAVAVSNGTGSPPGTPGSPTQRPSTGAAPAATPLSLIGGGLLSPSARPSSAAVATASPKPTKTPKPKATPKPTPIPVLALSASVTSPVNAGANATVTARTHPGARCSIEVDYSSGASTASGLNNKTANASGSVSWTWKVGSNTTPGTSDIYVACSRSGLEKTKHLTFRVR